jgi:hypothetical protein
MTKFVSRFTNQFSTCVFLGAMIFFKPTVLRAELLDAPALDPTEAGVTPVSPIDKRSRLGRMISLAPEPTSALTEMVARIAVADLQDLLAEQSQVERISAQLSYELRAAQLERGPGFLAKVLRLYAENGVNLATLRAIIFAKTKGEALQIQIPTNPRNFDKKGLAPAIKEANLRLARTGVDFVKFVAVSDESAQRLDLALPEHEAKRAKMEKVRNILVPVLAFLSSSSAGYFAASGHTGLDFWLRMAPPLLLGGLGFATEWQFSKFSNWWNKNVWQRLDAAGPAIANATIPFIFYLAGWGAELAAASIARKAGVEVDFQHKGIRELASSVASNFMLFMGSFGLAQTALARLTKRGELSEGPRFGIESPICMVANSGRSIEIAANFLGGSGSAKFYAQLYAYAVQGLVFATVSVPGWAKLIFGDRAYDGKTARLFAAQQGPTSGKTGCGKSLSLLGRLFGWSSRLQFSQR